MFLACSDRQPEISWQKKKRPGFGFTGQCANTKAMIKFVPANQKAEPLLD
jgi:hypothetical protein